MSDAVRSMAVADFGGDAIERANKILIGIPGGVDTVVKNAMPRAASALKTGSAKAIQERYDISAANLRTNENVKISYDYKNGFTANILFNGKKIPLYRYNKTSPKMPSADTGKTVNVILSGGWRTVHPGKAASAHQLKNTAPKKFNDAFVAKMKSGHIGIFERTGGVSSNGNDQIKELQGSSVPQMLGSKEVQDKLAETVSKKFEDRMNHEITRILNGWGK